MRNNLLLKHYLGMGKKKSGGVDILLPVGYTLLDYIESTGEQYINTPVYPTDDMQHDSCGILFNVSFTRIVDNRQLHGINYFWIGIDEKGFFESAPHFISKKKHDEKCIANKKYDLYIEGSTPKDEIVFKVDGTVNAKSTYRVKGHLSLFIGCLNFNDNPNFYSKSKIFGVKYFKRDLLLHHYVPCISPKKDVGMYDLVDEQFFGSASDTPFIAGNPI